MSVTIALRKQFQKPTGVLGTLAGVIMAWRPSNRRRNEWAVSLLDIGSHDRVLEIGFGPGYAIASMTRLSAHIVGVDHSQTMVTMAARRNHDAIMAGRVRLECATIESAVELGPFAKVLAVNSWHGWKDDSELLYRCVEAGGRVVIAEQPRSAGATDATARAVGEEMAQALRIAGFEEVSIEMLAIKPVAVAAAIAVKSTRLQGRTSP